MKKRQYNLSLWKGSDLVKEEFKWLLGRVLNDYYKNSDIKEEISRISFEDAYQNNLIRFFL